MLRDHEVLRSNRFRGLYDRGEDEVCPKDFFLSCSNLEFTERAFKTRRGSSLDYTLSNIRRIAIYRIAGQAQRLLILNSSGSIYDSTNLATPILTIATMTDFSMVPMNDRAYITPHNGTTGITGESVYVYTGSGTARAAAAVPPSGFTLVAADSATSGKVEEGTHLIGVAYITNTGFITEPAGFVAFSSVGGRKLDISNIGTGPAYVAARILVASKVVSDFNGDFVNQEYFFVPSGQINDNTTSTLTIDFYDADLTESADYLMDQLSAIPAGCCITNYNNRLCVSGSNLNPSVVYVSKAGEPEAFDEIEGFFEANTGDAGSGVKNLYAHREQLIVLKSQRSYFTSDNGENAVFWKPLGLDMANGTEVHGVGKIGDFGELIEEKSVIATRQGLKLFAGVFGEVPLTWNIDDVWERINKAAFNKVEVVVDAEHSKIYVALPLDAETSPSTIYVGDFSQGLDPEKIKWCPWSFPVAPVSIVVDTINSTQEPTLKFAGYSGNVYKMDSTQANDFGTAIVNYAEFPLYLPQEEDVEDGIYHFGGVLLRIKGSGTLNITAKNQDSTVTLTAETLTLEAAPGADRLRLFDMVAQKCSVKISLALINETMTVTKFGLLYKWLWAESPQ